MFSVLVTKVPRTGLQPKRAHSAHVEASWGFRLKDPCGAWAAQGRPAAPGRSELAPQASTSASRCFRHGPTTLLNAQDGPRPPFPRAHQDNFSGSFRNQNSQMFDGFLVFLGCSESVLRILKQSLLHARQITSRRPPKATSGPERARRNLKEPPPRRLTGFLNIAWETIQKTWANTHESSDIQPRHRKGKHIWRARPDMRNGICTHTDGNNGRRRRCLQ